MVVFSICLLMVFAAVALAVPLIVTATIDPLINFQSGLGITDILICKQKWSKALRVGYKVSTCFFQFLLPIAVVVSKTIDKIMRNELPHRCCPD